MVFLLNERNKERVACYCSVWLVASTLLCELFKRWKQLELLEPPQTSSRIQTWIGAFKPLARAVWAHDQDRTLRFWNVTASLGVNGVGVVVDGKLDRVVYPPATVFGGESEMLNRRGFCRREDQLRRANSTEAILDPGRSM